MRAEDVVTDHAVVRWLERHDGVDLTEARQVVGELAPDGHLLRYLEQHEGYNIAAIRERICSPAVLVAIGCGATGVRNDRVRLVITDGKVITIKFPWQVPPGGRRARQAEAVR